MAGLSGAWYTGQNASVLGAAGPGFLVYNGRARPVDQNGGWLQLALTPPGRISLHLFGGFQNNSLSCAPYLPQDNRAYAANLYFRLAPNVILALEAARVRTDWAANSRVLQNHYDLALAYLF